MNDFKKEIQHTLDFCAEQNLEKAGEYIAKQACEDNYWSSIKKENTWEERILNVFLENPPPSV